jgi:hypothetical protein
MSGIILTVLTPVAVLIATAVVKAVLPSLQGWKIVGVVVPMLSALYTWLVPISQGEGIAWYFQVLLGFAAVFIHQLYQQISEAGNP